MRKTSLLAGGCTLALIVGGCGQFSFFSSEPAGPLPSLANLRPEPSGEDYAILVARSTQADKEWSAVVAALVALHPGASVLAYASTPAEMLPALQTKSPRWICWVARPEELGSKPVAAMHQLARSIDEDPYVDAFWGIVTGDDAASALALASPLPPLTVRKVVANTEFAMECVEDGKWFSELKAGEVWIKGRDGQPMKRQGDPDSTAGLVLAFNEEKPDAILTSGHASERDWQPGYAYRNGVFSPVNGKIVGKALDGSVHEVNSPNPKVYLGVGNCLIGNVPGKPGCMATAWMRSGGVKQFVGYTVPTWYGYGGWGVLDYFLEQPGRFSLTEAFFANQQALFWRLAGTPGDDDRRGLEYDRDALAFYGDPQWEACLAPGPLRWAEDFQEISPGVFTWTITPTAGAQSFATVNANGSQRGGRPLVCFLPRRFSRLELLEGEQWKPALADDFVLLPRPSTTPESIVIRFKAIP